MTLIILLRPILKFQEIIFQAFIIKGFFQCFKNINPLPIPSKL